MKHRIFIDSLHPIPAPGDEIPVEGEEAEHARKSRRLGPGAAVEVLNGRGIVLDADIAEAKRSLLLRVRAVRRVEPVSPRIEVWGATPKGGRVDQMIDALAEVGAASWRPLETQWGVVEPRDTKLARLERVAREASKQCGRAWLMEIGPSASLDQALAADDGTRVILADARGAFPRAEGSANIRLLIGPEGGWSPEERARAERAGAEIVRFGVHAMRIEVAAPIAAAIILQQEQHARADV